MASYWDAEKQRNVNPNEEGCKKFTDEEMVSEIIETQNTLNKLMMQAVLYKGLIVKCDADTRGNGAAKVFPKLSVHIYRKLTEKD